MAKNLKLVAVIGANKLQSPLILVTKTHRTKTRFFVWQAGDIREATTDYGSRHSFCAFPSNDYVNIEPYLPKED